MHVLQTAQMFLTVDICDLICTDDRLYFSLNKRHVFCNIKHLRGLSDPKQFMCVTDEPTYRQTISVACRHISGRCANSL